VLHPSVIYICHGCLHPFTISNCFFFHRKNNQRTIEELQRTIVEIETRYKSELGRLKKKYDSEIREYEITVENLNRVNADLTRQAKGAGARVKVRLSRFLSLFS